MTPRYEFPFAALVIACFLWLGLIGIAVWIPCWLFGLWCD